MKIACRCGNTIYDQTDYLPHKARFIADQDWPNLFDSIDAAIEKSGPSATEKEAACMKIRNLMVALARLAWQCAACGRVYIDDQAYKTHQLLPSGDGVLKGLFRSRKA